jgi:hypothetical protein
LLKNQWTYTGVKSQLIVKLELALHLQLGYP